MEITYITRGTCREQNVLCPMSASYSGTLILRRTKGLTKDVRYSEASLYPKFFLIYLLLRYWGLKNSCYTEDLVELRYTKVALYLYFQPK